MSFRTLRARTPSPRLPIPPLAADVEESRPVFQAVDRQADGRIFWSQRPELGASQQVVDAAPSLDRESQHCLATVGRHVVVADQDDPLFAEPKTARVNTVSRHLDVSYPLALDDEVLSSGDLTMDLARHQVRRGERQIQLGPTEFRLLRHFLEHPGRVFSREQLLDAAWGRDAYVEQRTVDVHIRRLRKALNAPGEKDPIRTVRSAGYAFED